MGKHVGHLVHVDALPEDCVQIHGYNKHEFNNLYYSSNSNNLYQKYPKRIREIPLVNRILVRSDKGQTIYISLKKLKKLVSEL